MDSFVDLPAVTAPPEHHGSNASPTFSGNGAHPPYSEMIIAAISALNDRDGSSRQSIAKYMEREYSNLPPTHPTLLTHHLKQMKNEGQLMMIKHSYALPPPRSVPTPVMDNHFTGYSITAATDSLKPEVTPRRKPGRPPKPRHDFGYQAPPSDTQPYQPHYEHDFQTQTQTQTQTQEYGEPPIFASLGLADDGVTPPPRPEVSAKRGRGRPPKGSTSTSTSGSAEGKLMPISMVNGGVVKRGRPKRIGALLTTRPRGRPKRIQTVSGDAASASVSRGPPKNKFRNSFGRPTKVGAGPAVLVTDPEQLVAYQELKLKYQHLQSKAKEVVDVVRPYINPDYEAFGALQELESLVEPSPSYV